MKSKFVILLVVVAIGLVGLNAFLFFRLPPRATQQNQTNLGTTIQTPVPTSVRSIPSITPQELPMASKETAWPVYTNAEFGYTIEYEPDFKIDKRGKIGALQDLTAFNYVEGKSVTVVKIEVSDEAPKDTTRVVSEKGKDGNGNEVLVYNYPYKNNKSIILTGTIYPNIGGDFRFEEVITRMAQSLKIQ